MEETWKREDLLEMFEILKRGMDGIKASYVAEKNKLDKKGVASWGSQCIREWNQISMHSYRGRMDI